MLARQISICLYVLAAKVNVGKRGDKRGERGIRIGNDKVPVSFLGLE